MKTKPYLIKKVSFFILFFMSGFIFAQAPDRMSYQAVIRDASNNLVANAAVGIKISILQTTATGTVVYQESQTPTTNANGLATLQIGGGTVIAGDVSTIDWSMGPYFIKTETDPTGGTSYTITATTQLMSVPYALYAKTSGSSGSNLWTKTGTNLYPTTLTDNTGIGTTTPTAKLDILGNGGTDVVISPDLSGNSRVANNVNNTISNTGNNVGIVATAGNGKTNVGIYTTTTQGSDGSGFYQGLVIDNYDNHLVTDAEVQGIYNDVGNAGTGNTTGIKTYTGGSATSTGIDNTVTFGENATGISSFADGNSSTGINSSVFAETGNATGIYNGAVGFGEGNAVGERVLGISASGSNTPTTIGSTIIADGYSNIPGNQIGVKSYNYSEEVSAEATNDFDMANPAGLFIADGGSGQGIFAQTTGKGYNNLSFYSPVAEAVKGIAFSNQNAANIGIEGQAGNGTNLNAGVLGLLDGSTYLADPATISVGVLGLDYNGLPNTYAGYFGGQVNISDGTQDAGRVLTSDANGNASWQDVVTPDVHLSGANSGMISIPGNNSPTLLNDWQNLDEASGANYNPATGEYTIPVTGYYSIFCHLTWVDQVPADADNLNVSIAINNSVNYIGFSNQTDSGKYPSDCMAQAEVKLNAGDIISFYATANANETISPFTNFGIHLLHK